MSLWRTSARQKNEKVDEVVAFCFLYNGGGTENVKKKSDTCNLLYT